ncbi:hypothetical protein N7448_005003 [Penicillium atrosanguineum]|uniref:Uncharacterized protein n=1 Tax=Penicillium atrosanguineum TaxID=1132637 RepID=A0A9W9H2J1_9EURO|nr:fungal-specific transcription factor domain-containing protein [Penicillium atrosanguineum]KAJ5125685.1 hypothetical protein N7526_007862 [Penicillium atrosanguineum]KAJ5136449.1 hypothetical protein N7448_005003 [Penicillium atrosanguineum]KAJ5292779.1 fungal-specific transcription factor domain-containing protein [Penicillium atrosanguineum]KAJ5303181.1 hypothetical protein N7476_009980 [Penicillium atrosanguineum]
MLPFPPPDAGPKQVRAYVVQLLTTRHDADLDFAESIADLWQLGRGVDFRSAINIGAVLDVQNVFGDSVGPFLYRSAREEFIADYRCSLTGLATSWALKAALVLGLLLVVRGIRQPSEKKVQAFIEAGFVVGISAFIIGLIDMFHVISGGAATLGACGIVIVGISSLLAIARAQERQIQDYQKTKEK